MSEVIGKEWEEEVERRLSRVPIDEIGTLHNKVLDVVTLLVRENQRLKRELLELKAHIAKNCRKHEYCRRYCSDRSEGK